MGISASSMIKRYVYCSCLILEWCANLEAIVVKFEKSINKESSLRLKGNVSVISSDHLLKKLLVRFSLFNASFILSFSPPINPQVKF